MFIQTQPTPNPSSMMFLPGQTVLEVTSTPKVVETSDGPGGDFNT